MQNEEAFKSKMMEIIDDDAIEWVQQKMKAYSNAMSYYRCAMMEIEAKFNVLNEEYSMIHERNPISSIKTRLKSFDSIMEKLERKNLKKSVDAIIENLSDIAGVRVVCSFTDDVYSLADSLLKQDDITLIEKKDYIKNPKANGYRSLHLIVEVPIFLSDEKRMMKVEIQLRTIAMDFWASLEHQLKYKTDSEVSAELAEQLKECAETIAATDTKMQSIYQTLKAIN